jgi:hypothetical protein
MLGWGLIIVGTMQTNAQRMPEYSRKLTGQMELSAYPVHKASLLGLTSTEYPTAGVGVSGSYGRWSFYATSFHEVSATNVFLSQFEENISYRVFSSENISCTIFNTSVSTTKNSAIYMIPTLAVVLGRKMEYKFDLTPYTWGFNTDVGGYTYTLSYNYSKSIRRELDLDIQTKVVYTHVDPPYKGAIAELSPILRWKSWKVQIRTIYQFTGKRFIYDLSFRKCLSFN